MEDQTTITVYGNEQFGGKREVRYQEIKTTQLYELILTTFYLTCSICVKQQWSVTIDMSMEMFIVLHCCRVLTNLL